MTSTVRENAAAGRYEVVLDDGTVAGYAEFHDRGDHRAFTHTIVEPEWEGHGLAGQLIGWALADCRARGLQVLPFCPFVRHYLLEHAELRPLVPDAERERFSLPTDPPAYVEGERRSYSADGITVSYDRALCQHAGECVRGLPEVFHPEERPWITPQRAPSETVADVVRRCPSGALRYTPA